MDNFLFAVDKVCAMLCIGRLMAVCMSLGSRARPRLNWTDTLRLPQNSEPPRPANNQFMLYIPQDCFNAVVSSTFADASTKCAIVEVDASGTFKGYAFTTQTLEYFSDASAYSAHLTNRVDVFVGGVLCGLVILGIVVSWFKR